MIKNVLDKAKMELDNRPVVAIDYALRAFSVAKREKVSHFRLDLILKVFVQAVRFKILGIEADSLRYHSINSLFDRSLRRQDKRFVAICLLRLLCVNHEYFRKNSELYVKTFDLFDKELSEDLYKRLKIGIKEQTYEKESKLKDAVPKIESDLDNIVLCFNSLEMISGLRERFMKTINSPLSKAIILPFVPKELVTSRLDEIFKSVEKYRESTNLDTLREFQEAQQVLGAYLQAANNYETTYSVRYLGGLAEKLKELLEKDFYENPVSKPADLTIRKSEKKYPFGVINADVDLQFIVQNIGPGYAFDISLEFRTTDNLQIKHPRYYLGHLEPTCLDIEIPGKVVSAEEIALVSVEVYWTNFDRTSGKRTFEFDLQGQRSDIVWEDLVNEEPYSLEPVTTGAELVDRKEIINQLLAQARAKSVGSSYIYGQRRVGKTSIVKTLKTHLMNLNLSDYLAVYIEVGKCIHPDPAKTIEFLGKRICREIKRADNRFSELKVPDFSGALSPLVDFLDQVLEIAPNYRTLFILDEFDELPLDLYKRGPVGNAFFLTIRSISGDPSFGFVLVGGEKMEFIMSCQGDVLNKFQAIPLDYFSREKHWVDFQELVRMPVSRWIEVSDDALVALYEETRGNPYFTKLICGSLFKMMVERRDCHVTHAEVEDAKDRSLESVKSNSFQHFWEDGIFESGDREEEISIRRRKVLLCIADAYRRRGIAMKKDILASEIGNSLDPPLAESDLREFERRQVLIVEDSSFDCKVPFFKEWLIKKGIRDIITSFSDLDAILKRKQQEEEAYVGSEEIVELVGTWGLYQGRRITEDLVRVWLRQFGDNTNQRLMFRILKNISFYTEDHIRSKMKEAHGIVIRGLVRRIEAGKRRRGDILVSYLDSPGKSGAYYAKLYADENEIYVNNVVERGRLRKALETRQEVQALVFVDDFMGTGDSASEYFKKIAEECGEVLRNRRGLRTFFITVCGFRTAQVKVEGTLVQCSLPVKVHTCDPLDESAKCFSERSQIFPDAVERNQAKTIADEHGRRLVKRNPLGYGNCQATVVFAHSCPNNSLPILWKESKNPPWKPLFKRC